MKKILSCLLLGLIIGSANISAQDKFSLSAETWSKKVNLKQDISTLSYEELYVLRALVYATHGKWYTEMELNKLLMSKANWYYEHCLKVYEKNNFNEPEFKLSKSEQAFVDKIDARMQELNAQLMQGRSLQNPKLCVNLSQLDKPSEKMLNLLDTSNLAFERTSNEQLFNIYEENDYRCMPSFVTSDLYLQLSHMYLSYIQKYIEQKQFVAVLDSTYTDLYNAAKALKSKKPAVNHRIGYVQTYSAIGLTLLNGNNMDVPSDYNTAYLSELSSVNNAVDMPSALMQTSLNFFYSQFKPRGHYTRSEAQQRFFRSMMWAQNATFNSANEEMVKNAVTLAVIYNSLPEASRTRFENMGNVIEQLTGNSDNVSILQLASWLKANNLSDINVTEDKAKMKQITDELTRLNAQGNKLSSDVEKIEGFSINLMPQRYLIDNDILLNMADKTVNALRPFPRGVDVFAALGSTTASDLQNNFYKDAESWANFSKQAGKMREKFSDRSSFTGSIYYRRLALLADLAKSAQQGSYSFTSTPAWQYKNLNTALGSWTTLKHDAILYAEQPIMAECGGGDMLKEPVAEGFVEPNVQFWEGLDQLVRDAYDWLKRCGYADEELNTKSESLIESIGFCKKVAQKEINGEMPSYDDCMTISKIGSHVEWLTLGLIEPGVDITSWSYVTSADRSMAVVADIFTRQVRNCQKNGVKYSATGNANAMYVLVKIGEKTYITRGATYSYYEFVLPPTASRLTDEEWQKMLDNGTATDMEQWFTPYFIEGKQQTNEKSFYGSGC